jgi:hypothetical protein
LIVPGTRLIAVLLALIACAGASAADSRPVPFRRPPYPQAHIFRPHRDPLSPFGVLPVPPAPVVTAAPVPYVAPAFPGPAYYLIPDELPATAENAQEYVALAHRAMAHCHALTTASADYRGAVSALDAKRYRVAMAASRNVVDDCTGL